MSLADDFAGMRATINSFLPETATIARTSQMLACAIRDGKRDLRMNGIPDFMRLRQWNLRFPDGSDVQANDVATILNRGVYQVLGSLNPESYSLSNDLTACRIDAPDARIVSNATVTFRQQKTEERKTGIAVTLNPVDYESKAGGYALEFTHTVIWKDTLVFSDGNPPTSNDYIEYAVNGKTKEAPLLKPRRWSIPYPIAQAAFKET